MSLHEADQKAPKREAHLHWPHLKCRPLDVPILLADVRLHMAMAVHLQVENSIQGLFIGCLTFCVTACGLSAALQHLFLQLT